MNVQKTNWQNIHLRLKVRIRKKEEFSLKIYRQKIGQLYLGFDEAFNASETSGLRLHWLP